MIKKVLGVLTIAGLLVSCGNAPQQKEAKAEKEITKLKVEQVLADIGSYVEKEIVIAGTVNHVCAHGGKRMFIIGEENTEEAIKITPNETIGVFEKELEGSHVLVTGIVKELKIDEAYVAKLEQEVAEGNDSEAVHDHSAGTHDEKEADEEKQAQFKQMRDKIAESENGYYSQFWIEASKFEAIECDHDHSHAEEAHDHEHDHDHAEGEEHTH